MTTYMESAVRPHCFVLMPFTVRDEGLYQVDHWHNVYRDLILPAVTGAGFTCERDDEDRRARNMALDIFRKIEDADMIVCDVSSHNPNVLLELGWALRANKRIVLIKDELTDRQFHLTHFYTVDYSRSLSSPHLANNQRTITEAIKGTATGERRLSLPELIGLHTTSTDEKNALLTEEALEQLESLSHYMPVTREEVANLREFVILLRREQVALRDRVAHVETALSHQ